MKLKKQLSNRESVQDNNSINLMNAINTLGLANWQSVRKSNKRIRSMEIESNSFSDSSKRREQKGEQHDGDESVNEDEGDYESGQVDDSRPRAQKTRRFLDGSNRNNTLPNQSVLNARNHLNHRDVDFLFENMDQINNHGIQELANNFWQPSIGYALGGVESI